MGTLVLPPSGAVYVDANTVIYAVEKVAPFAALLNPLWAAANAGQLSLVTSELTWLETLVKPLRDHNTVLERLFRAFLTSREVMLLPVTLALWEEAAKIRSFGLKTPDALHAATCLYAGCKMFLTNDLQFQRVPDLPVVVLQTVLSS